MKGMTGERLQRLAAQAMLFPDPQGQAEMARALGPLLDFLGGEEGGQGSGQEGSWEARPEQEPTPDLPPDLPPEPPAFSGGRPDAVEESLPLNWVLANAPRTWGPFIRLPGVLE